MTKKIHNHPKQTHTPRLVYVSKCTYTDALGAQCFNEGKCVHKDWVTDNHVNGTNPFTMPLLDISRWALQGGVFFVTQTAVSNHKSPQSRVANRILGTLHHVVYTHHLLATLFGISDYTLMHIEQCWYSMQNQPWSNSSAQSFDFAVNPRWWHTLKVNTRVMHTQNGPERPNDTNEKMKW